jgi:fluoride exporter
MENIVMIGVAGMAGTLARYWLSTTIDERVGPAFPYGTVAVNLIGCFIIGFLFYAFGEQLVSRPVVRNAVFVGFLGGFTTFSSFGIQTFTLLVNGQPLAGAANILISNVGGLICVWAGSLVSRIT